MHHSPAASELTALAERERGHLGDPTIARLLDLAVPLDGIDRHSGYFGFQPWLISKVTTDKGVRVIAVEGKPAALADWSEMVVSIFDLGGNCVFASRFPAGHKVVIEGATISPEHGLQLLIVDGTPRMGRDIRRQYYAVHNDMITTARLSDSNGRAARNSYSDFGAEFGPTLLCNTAADIEAQLRSG